MSITSAREPLSDDIARRTNRYLWQMSIRVVCFVGALLVDHWTRWLLVAGAVVLPYVAVVLANAGQDRPETGFSPVGPAELPPGQRTTRPLGPAAGPPAGDARVDDTAAGDAPAGPYRPTEDA